MAAHRCSILVKINHTNSSQVFPTHIHIFKVGRFKKVLSSTMFVQYTLPLFSRQLNSQQFSFWPFSCSFCSHTWVSDRSIGKGLWMKKTLGQSQVRVISLWRSCYICQFGQMYIFDILYKYIFKLRQIKSRWVKGKYEWCDNDAAVSCWEETHMAHRLLILG